MEEGPDIDILPPEKLLKYNRGTKRNAADSLYNTKKKIRWENF